MENDEVIPEKFNCAAYTLGRMAAACPDNVAFLTYDGRSYNPLETWTYSELENSVLRTTNGLQSLGLKIGDRVLIRMGNTIWFPISFLACLSGGFVPIPTSDRLSQELLNYITVDSRPLAILHDNDTLLPSNLSGIHVLGLTDLEKLRESPLGLYARTLSYDPAFLVYSDGQSELPRGILHAHRTVWGRKILHKEWLNLKEKDRIIHPGADDWGKYFNIGVLDPLCKGASSILLVTKDIRNVYGKALPVLLELTQATILMATPSHYRIALNHNTFSENMPHHLRVSISSGTYLPKSIFESWIAKTQTPIYDGYDLAEVACPISSGPHCPPKYERIGKTHTGRKSTILPLDAGLKNLAIGEIGVIAIHRSDPTLMLGYWNNAPLTKASVRGAWFLTDDIGRRDKDGYIQFEGRIKDLIEIQGYRINPEDIEIALSNIQGIQEIAVTQGFMPEVGEILIAFIVSEHKTILTIPELNKIATAELPDYKRPKQWIEVDELPKTASGKIARSILKQLVQ